MKNLHFSKKYFVSRARMLIVVAVLILMVMLVPTSVALAGWATGGGY